MHALSSLSWQLAAAYCAGLITPIVLMAAAIFAGPVLGWLDRVNDRVRRWLDEEPAEPPTEELEPLVEQTVRMSDAWDYAARELTHGRRPRHRA